jgi:hypothetical protein
MLHTQLQPHPHPFPYAEEPAHVHGISALAHRLLATWVLDLVYEAPLPSLEATCSPLDESLYFSVTEMCPLISKSLLATWQFCSWLDPLLHASLTLAWSVTVCLSGMTMFWAPIWVWDPADSEVNLAYPPALSCPGRRAFKLFESPAYPEEYPDPLSQMATGWAQPQANCLAETSPRKVAIMKFI